MFFEMAIVPWCKNAPRLVFHAISCSVFQGSEMPDSDASLSGGGDLNRPPTRSSVTCKCLLIDFQSLLQRLPILKYTTLLIP